MSSGPAAAAAPSLPRASVGGVGLARRSVRPFTDLGDGPVVGDVDLEQIEVLQASASLAGTIKQGMVEDDRRPRRFRAGRRRA